MGNIRRLVRNCVVFVSSSKELFENNAGSRKGQKREEKTNLAVHGGLGSEGGVTVCGKMVFLQRRG